MNPTVSTRRESVEKLERQYIGLLTELTTLVRSTPQSSLYQPAAPSQGSIAENVIKSAGSLEQTLGGLTSNLWDDPFEWTLPETLSTTDLIIEYLAEVEVARGIAFARFVDDSALDKYIAVPSGDQKSIQTVLIDALERATSYKRRAVELRNLLSADAAAGFII